MLPSIGFKFSNRDESVLRASGFNKYRLNGLDYEVAEYQGGAVQTVDGRYVHLFGVCRIERVSTPSEYDKDSHSWTKAYESYEAALVTELVYENIFGLHDGRIRVRKNGLFGFLDESLLERIPCVYKDVTSFNGGMAMVTDAEDRRYMIDVTGAEVSVPV